jgi:hypothetical protein
VYRAIHKVKNTKVCIKVASPPFFWHAMSKCCCILISLFERLWAECKPLIKSWTC